MKDGKFETDICAKFWQDMQESLAYGRAHRTELRHEGCRSYAIELCNYPPQLQVAPERRIQVMPDYPNPTDEDLQDPVFEAVGQAIKGWDLSRESNGMYHESLTGCMQELQVTTSCTF